MESERLQFREQLLAQSQPDERSLSHYHKEIAVMFQDQERRLKWQAWGAAAMWVYTTLLATAFLLLAGYTGKVPGPYLAIATAFVLLIGAAVEIVKLVINRTRIELLKELKSLELQVMALRDASRPSQNER